MPKGFPEGHNGGQAERLGVLPGDVVTAVAGTDTTASAPAEVLRRIKEAPRPLVLGLWRTAAAPPSSPAPNPPPPAPDPPMERGCLGRCPPR